MYNEGFFYNAIKRDIAMVRGDTMAFAFQVKGLQGQAPEHIYFTCKSKIEDEDAVFMVSDANTIDLRSYESETDIFTYTVRIPPNKTAELELGRYFYDLKVEVDSDVITLMIGRLSIEYDVHKSSTIEPPAYDDGDNEVYPQEDIPEGQKKIYTEQNISNIASAIIAINESETGYTVEEMSEAIADIGDTITALEERIQELVDEFPPEIDEVSFPTA